MQQNILDEAQVYLADFQQKTNSSNTLAQIFSRFLESIHHALELFTNQLGVIAETFYNDLAKTPEENEVNLFHYNTLSNTMLNLSHDMQTSIGDIFVNTIEPFQLFCDNYKETNVRFVDNFSNYLKGIEQTRSVMFKRQEDYLRVASELDKLEQEKQAQKRERSKMSVNYAHTKSRFDDCFVEYRNSIVNHFKQMKATVNSKWERFNDEIRSLFDGFDLNEQSRTHMTKSTVQKFITAFVGMMKQSINNIMSFQQTSETKLNIIEAKQQKEKQSTMKLITRNRKFNIFKVSKKEDFISYEEWKKHLKNQQSKSTKKYISETFDSSGLSKLKFDQIMQSQVEKLVRQLNDFTQYFRIMKDSLAAQINVDDIHLENRTKTNGLEELQITLRQQEKQKYDLETIFTVVSARLYFLEEAQKIIDTAHSSKLAMEGQAYQQLLEIANALLVNSQRELSNDVNEYYLLMTFLTFYGRRDRGPNFISLGAEAGEKTSLFFERDLWQRLLLYLNDKENLPQLEVKKLTTQDVLSLQNTNRKGRSAQKPMNHEQKVQYLKSLQNLQQINSWMLALNLRVDFAGETIILLAKMCNIKVQDIVLLLEQQESLKVCADQQQIQVTQQKKTVGDKDTKILFIMRQVIKYLRPNDWLNLILSGKQLLPLRDRIQRFYLANLSVKERRSLWAQQLQPNQINIDYYALKEKYSRSAYQHEQMEQQIAQDVSRSFNTQGVSSSVNHLTLHNLLKLYAFYNPTISYTQGMNFIMGFIYTVFEEEEVTFRCFASLINNKLRDVLMYDLKNIRVFFYKLERLQAIYIPDVYQHLKDEKIEAGHYAAPWFITLFSNSFTKNHFSNVVFEVWDIYLGRGWRGFYQVLLALFEIHKAKLLQMKFDHLMQFLNNLHKHEFFENEDLKQLKKVAKSFKISPQLLESLEKEYYLVRQKINILMNY